MLEAQQTGEKQGRRLVSQAVRETAGRASRQRVQVEEERQGDGEVDVVGIYGFWVNGVDGGVALSRSRLALRSNDGIALAKPRECHCELGSC